MFLDYTQRRSTVGRTPLDEWSARRRDLYLTTHDTHNRRTSIPPVGFEPTISAGERPQTYALDRAATGTGRVCMIWYIFNCNWVATRWQLFSTHIHTNNTGNVTKQTIHRTPKYIEQHRKYIEQHNNLEECGPCPVFAGFTLAFALQLRKKHGKTSVRVFIHSLIVCLTTGPKPLPKRALHIVRSRASSFKWEYPLLSLTL